MVRLIYTAIASLDGYVEDGTGRFDWAAPDEEVHAIGAGLVDEYQLFLCPIVVGGGRRALPADVRAGLELVDERRFRRGVVHLHYRVGT